MLSEWPRVILRSFLLNHVPSGETAGTKWLCPRQLINLCLHHLKRISLLLCLLCRRLFFLTETQRSAILCLRSLNGTPVVAILDLVLGDLDDLLGVVELLFDDKGIDHFTGFARSEAMGLSLLGLDLLLLNYVCLLLLHNCILHCTWNVIRVNDEIVDVNLNEPRSSILLCLDHLRPPLPTTFLGVTSGGRRWLGRLDQIPAYHNLSSGSGSGRRILLLLLITHKAVVVAILLHE